MSIKNDVAELQAIKAEIQSLNTRRTKLREQLLAVETRIAQYLKSKEQPGLKNNGLAIILEEKETLGHKRPKDRDTDSIAVLERYGIKDSQKVLSELMQARKGEKILKEKLKLQKYKTNN